jgi:spore maturation protein CgeB
MKCVMLGLSITSSWGNGHATTYRGLVKAMTALGHDVLFLERDVPWYAENRDLPEPPFGVTRLYASLNELMEEYESHVRDADMVLVGSYVPDGVQVGEWVIRTARGITVFYDIDTPVTLSGLRRNDSTYLSRELVRRYDLYLSFTGGPTLRRLEHEFGAQLARPLYCSVDPDLYFPARTELRWALGYLGTYSIDRQPTLGELLVKPAQQLGAQSFIVAGAQYPEDIAWPANVQRVHHIAPHAHRSFYAAQRFTLNVTRAEMVRAGYSPSVRLFEAAACGTPIISDAWPGLDTLLRPGSEVLVAHSAGEVCAYLAMPEEQRRAVAERARQRILSDHTSAHRALELEHYIVSLRDGQIPRESTCVERRLLAAQ